MHFLQGNGLVVDGYLEYKDSVKRIMEALVYKYSLQNRHEVLIEDLVPELKDYVELDYLDFYCIIECFDESEMSRLFNKNSLETIKFNDIRKIEQGVKNIIDYYISRKGKFKSYELMFISQKIKRVLFLLKYVEISLELVEKICSFILSYEIYGIYINDIVHFLDRQIYVRKNNSKDLIEIIENGLFSYMDNHKNCLDLGKKYNVFSTTSNINYYCLADYLILDGMEYVSRRLSHRVEALVDNNQLELYSVHYYNHVTKRVQKKLIRFLETIIEKNFSFDRLSILMNHKYKITPEVEKKLVEYLRGEIIKDDNPQNNSINSYPKKKKYESITQVGYWCFLDLIEKSPFYEFVGISDEFDFYYDYKKFDYKKFDVCWIMRMPPKALRILSSTKRIRNNIRNCLAKSLKENNYSVYDNNKIEKILIDHFC